MLSKIVPSSLQKIMLLCFPIISMISRFRQTSPMSSKCSRVISIIRSSPGWDTEIIRALPMCFLKSIQKLGAVMGLGLFASVRYTKGRLALAETNSRTEEPSFFI